MSEEKKKFYRLFKVAKELNVGSSTLVEHLGGKGFDVNNSPNEKLTSEMYAILQKEYASEKDLKEKAEQIREQQREGKNALEEGPSEEVEIISAEDLRSGILNRPGVKPAAEKAPAKKEPVAETKKETPVAKTEEKKPEVTAAPETPKEDEGDGSGIKVVGKIDLSQFDKKGKKVKKEEKKAPAAKDTPKEKPAPKVEEKPVAKVEKEAPKAEKKETPKAEDTPKEVPAEKETPKAEKKTPATKPVAKEESAEDAKESDKDEKAGDDDEVIRASERTPTLRGLKIKGKIELPSDKKKKAKDDDSSDAKKRKRKRKRKKPGTAVGNDNNNNNNNNRRGNNRNNSGQGRGKKEEPSEKEIRELIKNTLADINKRSGKNRQGIRRGVRDRHAQRRAEEEQKRMDEASTLEVTEFITANEFAQLIDVPVTDIISKCMELGLFVSINQRMEADVIKILGEEYNYDIQFVDITDQDYQEEDEEDDPEDLEPRSPIITVMGHVDHGKTLLLDHIRKANVISGEAGGITQHIGAYEVKREGGKITFLDTPGHEAFTAMRARGAKLTDVAIIVIAADDAVMPQTKEAINHAEAAGVPIIFAINKVDKANADPEKIKAQLAEMNYQVEDWGGKYQSQDISAKTGLNIDNLLEKILLEAELLELTANPNKPARGTIVEARMEKGRGVVATLLVQEGTLKVGDSFVAGVHYGKIRALQDEHGKRIKSAGPSQPVEILGLTGTPAAGDRFISYENDKQAKEIASKRQELDRQHKMRAKIAGRGLENWSRVIQQGKIQDLNVIIKGDVDGSVEALSDSLIKLSTDEVRVTVVMKGVGPITEADVNLASASDAIVLGFQVRPNASARKLAENEEVEIRLYSIIYDAIEEIKDAMSGLLSPEIKEEIVGTAQIRDTFKISKVGTIAGCMVTEGKIVRNNPIRIIRDGVVIYEGKLASLKRFKDDAKEVSRGFECGMQVEKYNDIKVNDVIESFKKVEVERTL